MTSLYHICKLEDEGDLTKGYIGISDNVESRLDYHFMGFGSSAIRCALAKFKELSFSVVYEGDRESCLLLEEMLRPEDRMGWNLVKGGGDPPLHTGPRKESWGKHLSESVRKVKREKNAHVWICDGLSFLSKLEAAEYFGVSRKTIKDRCDNPKFTTWYRSSK